MLETTPASSGLLFVSFLFREDLIGIKLIQSRAESLWGPCFLFQPRFNPLASYYSKEMGDSSLLKRLFLVPNTLQPRESILTGKLLALDWERGWAVEGKRMVNVDVGFLSLENFILATTKNYSHRIYLAQNIFADLTYQFSEGKFQSLPWTYPDYSDAEKIDFFTWLRSYLLEKIQTNA